MRKHSLEDFTAAQKEYDSGNFDKALASGKKSQQGFRQSQKSAKDNKRESFMKQARLYQEKDWNKVLNFAQSAQKVDPDDVAVGTTIVVKPGERIPLDGIVLKGRSFIDTSALTGESVHR